MTDSARPCTGPLQLGLPSEFFQGRPEVATVRTDAGTPVIWPLDEIPFWSKPFFVKFSRIHQISRSWYIDWDLLSRLNFDDLNWESIRGVNLAGCLLVSEVPETLLDVAESVVRAFARNLQLNISALHLLETEDAVEEYFVLHGTAQERFTLTLVQSGMAEFNVAWESKTTPMECPYLQIQYKLTSTPFGNCTFQICKNSALVTQ